MSKEIKELMSNEIAKFTLEEMYKALHESKGSLMELNLSSAREYIPNYGSNKNKLKRTISRLMYFIKKTEDYAKLKDFLAKFNELTLAQDGGINQMSEQDVQS